MTSVKLIAEYIRKKKNYEHTVGEIAERLMGVAFKSYGEPRYVYVQLAMKVSWARKKIEKDEKGHFIATIVNDVDTGRKVKQFHFESGTLQNSSGSDSLKVENNTVEIPISQIQLAKS